MKYPKIVIRDKGQSGDVVVERSQLVPVSEARGTGKFKKFKEGAPFESRTSGKLKDFGLYLDEMYDHAIVMDDDDCQVLIRIRREDSEDDL